MTSYAGYSYYPFLVFRQALSWHRLKHLLLRQSQSVPSLSIALQVPPRVGGPGRHAWLASPRYSLIFPGRPCTSASTFSGVISFTIQLLLLTVYFHCILFFFFLYYNSLCSGHEPYHFSLGFSNTFSRVLEATFTADTPTLRINSRYHNFLLECKIEAYSILEDQMGHNP